MRIRPLVLTGVAAAAAVLAAAGSASAATVSPGSPVPQGTASDLTASPASLIFAPMPVSSAPQPSAPKIVTITDTSRVPVHIAETDIGDANFDFNLDSTCGNGNVTLAPGGSCTLSIQYVPRNTGEVTNDAVVIAGYFGGITSALDIPLTGTGEADS